MEAGLGRSAIDPTEKGSENKWCNPERRGDRRGDMRAVQPMLPGECVGAMCHQDREMVEQRRCIFDSREGEAGPGQAAQGERSAVWSNKCTFQPHDAPGQGGPTSQS